MQKVRILHLEDEESISQVTRRLLQSNGWEIFLKRVETRESFEKALKESEFDLILADYSLPNFNGLTALQIAHQEYPDIPFILFSGSIGEEKAIASLREGATDYVLKQNIGALLPAVERAIEESKIRRERRQALQALELSEEKYRMLFEQAPEGILFLDDQNIIKDCNPAATSLLGHTKEELLGHTISELLSPASRNDFKHELPDFKKNGSAEGIREFVQKNGQIIPVWRKVKALYNQSGVLYGSIVYLRDNRKLQQAHQIEQMIYHIASSALRDNSIDDFLKKVEEELSQIIDTTNFFVGLYNKKNHTISLPFMQDKKDSFSSVPIANTFSEQVIKERRPILLRGVEVEQFRKEKNITRVGSAAKCWLGVPLQDGQEIIGLLVVQNYENPDAFGPDDLEILQFVGTQIAGIIKRKYMEHQLKLLSRAVEQNPASIVITDLKGNIEYVNPKFTEITQYTLQEALGKNPRILKSGKTPFKQYVQLWETISSGKVWRGRFLNKRKNGELFWEEAIITPVADDNGKPVNYLAIKEDITRMKEAEDAFMHISEMNNVLLENITSLLIVTNSEGIILRWNRIAEETLLLREDEAIGKTIMEINLTGDKEKLIEAIHLCRENEQRVDLVDFRCADTQGNDHFLNLHISSYRQNAQNEQPGFLILAEDITEWKQMQTQLNQAQKLEAIGQMASGIAHEINTPVQYIGDNIHFLLNSFSDVKTLLEFFIPEENEKDIPTSVEQLRQYAQEIDLEFLLQDVPDAFTQTLEGIDRVAQIVKAMKEFTHPGQKEKVPVDINRALQNTILISKNEWKYVADIETQFAENLPLVPAYLGELNQTFLNIIVNAAHAIEEVVKNKEKGRITIKTYTHEDSVRIEISDTGSGIKEEYLHKIFDPFFTTKEVGKGTGQGLTLAYKVITQEHGGSLWCESTVNKGTTFFIDLPLKMENED